MAVGVEAVALILATGPVAALVAAYRNPLILGAAILGFSGAGVGLIVGSALTTGWWQAFQLAVGVSLLFVGTVELGILGLLHHVLEADETNPQDPSGRPMITINRGAASMTFGASGLTASQLAELIAVLDGADESKVPAPEAVPIATPLTERHELRQYPETFCQLA